MKTNTKILLTVLTLAALLFTFAAVSVPYLAMRLAPVAAARAEVAALSMDLPHLEIEPLDDQSGGLIIGPLSFAMQGGPGDKLVLGGVFVLEEGETIEGSLVIMGGTATLETGSVVEQDVLLFGGSVNVYGHVGGDIVAIGGFADISETALVEGDVNAIGGHVTYDTRESIEGEVNTGMPPGGPIVIPGMVDIPDFPNMDMRPSFFNGWMSGVMSLVVWLLKAFMWAVLAVLAVLFLPRNIERTSNTVVSQPLISGGLGLLTVFAAPLLLVVVAITIIGIPISMVGLFVLMVAWAFGLVTIGVEVGKRLALALNQEWALPVSAAIGTLILTLIINGIGKLIPCVGWMVPALVGMVGLGAVMLTRFGTQDYPTAGAALVPSPAPAPAPPTPVVEQVDSVEPAVVDEPPPASTMMVDEPTDEPDAADQGDDDESDGAE